MQLIILSGGSHAESLCNLTANVWRNAIYEEGDPKTDKFTRPNGIWVSDFNDALANLYSASSTKSTINIIESNQAEVQVLMKEIQNPPEGLEKCYETMTELYTAYKGITDLAINPSGSLTSYSDLQNSRIRSFMDTYDKLSNQIPEKFETNSD